MGKFSAVAASESPTSNNEAQLEHQGEQTGQSKTAPYRFETKLVPASHLAGWLALLETGYEGNALEDTEYLYAEQ